jgi:hypothetical protein
VTYLFLWKIQRFFKNSLIILGDLWKKSKILKNSLIVSDDLPVFSEKIQRFFKNYPIVSGNLPVFMKKKYFCEKIKYFLKMISLFKWLTCLSEKLKDFFKIIILQVTYLFFMKHSKIFKKLSHFSGDLPLWKIIKEFQDVFIIIGDLPNYERSENLLKWSHYNGWPTRLWKTWRFFMVVSL